MSFTVNPSHHHTQISTHSTAEATQSLQTARSDTVAADQQRHEWPAGRVKRSIRPKGLPDSIVDSPKTVLWSPCDRT